jgi:hypothetical protein
MLDVPPLLEHLWVWFWHLDQARQSSGYGPQALSHVEIAAWAALLDEAPRPWEVAALVRMDVARRAALQPPEVANPTGLRNVVPTSDWRASMAAMDRMAAQRNREASK